MIGVSGQDGSIVAEKYADAGHEVIGITSKPTRSPRREIKFLHIDFSNRQDSNSFLKKFLPHRIYHLAAIHSSSTLDFETNTHVRKLMHKCHVEITQNILDWQRLETNCKSVVGLSSQMYSSKTGGLIVDEGTEFAPQNYYGETKVRAFSLIRNYRETYGIQSYGAILFNHTSSRSKSEFLFPQLVRQIKRVVEGNSSEVILKNPDFKLDICHASEVTSAMMQIIELEEASDFVISRGVSTSIRSMVASTFEKLNFNRDYVIKKSEPEPTLNEGLIGNPSKALRMLNWKATLSPEEILLEMLMD